MLFRRLLTCVLTAMSLCAVTCSAQAQTASASTAEKSKIRFYLEERWLSGSPEKLLEQISKIISLAPLKSVELLRKMPLPAATRQQIFDGIKAQQATLKVRPPDATEMRLQYDLLGACLEHKVSDTLRQEKLAALVQFIDTGLYKQLPRFRKPVEDWHFIALQRQSGVGQALFTSASTAAIQKDPERAERLTRLQSTYFALSDAYAGVQFVHDFIGAGVYFAVMGELFMMSENLPEMLKSQGLSDKEWEVLEHYGADGVYLGEASAVETCMKDPSMLIDSLKTYATGSVAAMKMYFEQNPGLLAPTQ